MTQGNRTARNHPPKKRRNKRSSGRSKQSPFTKYKKKLIKTIKKHKLKTAIIVLGILAILAVVLLHFMSAGERITSTGYTHADRFKDYVVVDGIDVSYAQGTEIDWAQVKKSGVDFVMIRAAYRDGGKGKLHKDTAFETNIDGASRAGLMVGAYIFSQALNDEEAQEEARYLMKIVKEHRIDLPLVMDYELFQGGRLQNATRMNLISTSQLSSAAYEFCQTVEDAGYESMVYGNYDFLAHYIDGKDLGQRTNIWLAHYNNETSYEYPYQMWQASDQATIPGINGNVDRDFWYVDPDDVTTTLASDTSNKTSIGDCNVQLADHTSRYMGFNVEPGVTVYNGSTQLNEGIDYTVSYIKNSNVGTGYAIVTGKGRYRDTVVTSFAIKKLL